jgi:hypothetical protein
MNVIFVSPKSWFRNEKHLTWDLGDTKSKALAKLVRKFDTRAPHFFFVLLFFGVSGMPQVGSSIPAFKICQSSPSWKKSGEKSHGFQQKSVTFPYQMYPSAPQDAQWHRWDDVLRPDGRLANFWKDLRTLRPKMGIS